MLECNEIHQTRGFKSVFSKHLQTIPSPLQLWLIHACRICMQKIALILFEVKCVILKEKAFFQAGKVVEIR